MTRGFGCVIGFYLLILLMVLLGKLLGNPILLVLLRKVLYSWLLYSISLHWIQIDWWQNVSGLNMKFRDQTFIKSFDSTTDSPVNSWTAFTLTACGNTLTACITYLVSLASVTCKLCCCFQSVANEAKIFPLPVFSRKCSFMVFESFYYRLNALLDNLTGTNKAVKIRASQLDGH